MSDDGRQPCALCGEATAGAPWLVLNRWIVGTGSGARAMVEALNGDNEYLWEMRPDGTAEDEFASGRVLHWPICAVQWIDMKMLEAAVEVRKRPSA